MHFFHQKDLSEWQHMIIETTETTSIHYYIENFPDEDMAQNFLNRTRVLSDIDFYSGFKSYENDMDYTGLVEGRVALVLDMDYLQACKHRLIEKFKLQEDIDFHVSGHGDNTQPFFTTINTFKVNDTLANVWNNV